MIRVAPFLALVALLLPALAAEWEEPPPDPRVERFLGDWAGKPMQATVCISVDLRVGAAWRGSSSRSVRAPATAPFRAELRLDTGPGAPEVRAEVRLENGLVVYDLTCLAPIPAIEEDAPPDTLRSVARGACSSFGELAVLPVPGAEPGTVARVAAWLTLVDNRDRDLFPPDRPFAGGPADRTVWLALREVPPGAGLPGNPESGAAEADAFLADTGSRELRYLSLRLAPGSTGSLESLVERSCLVDFDVEVCQSPTIPIFDPVPGAVPAGLAARVAAGSRDTAVDWTYATLLGTEQTMAVLGGGPPVRFDVPTVASTGGRLILRSPAALLPVATLADGGVLILDARATPVE